MPKVSSFHFTDRSLRALKPRPMRYEIADRELKGFGIRVHPDGAKVFFVRGADGDARARCTLGEFDKPPLGLSLAAARKKATEFKASGRPPGTEPPPEPAALTFGQAAAEWLETHSKPNKVSWREDERIVSRYLAPWKERPAVEISRRDAAQLLEPLLREGKLVMARQVKAVISPIYARLLDLEIVTANPVAGLKLPRSRPRDRVLTDKEMQLLWALWQNAGVQGALFQFLLLTGLRSGEAIRAQWAHASDDWLTIPDTKTGVAHRVYLTTPAKAILVRIEGEVAAALDNRAARAHRADGSAVLAQEAVAYEVSPWVFDSPRRPGRPFARANELTKTFRADSGIAGWTAHDLRRTCATGMGRLEIEADIIDRCLNHARDSVSVTYNRARYERKMAEAWRAWASRLEEIVT